MLPPAKPARNQHRALIPAFTHSGLDANARDLAAAHLLGGEFVAVGRRGGSRFGEGAGYREHDTGNRVSSTLMRTIP